MSALLPGLVITPLSCLLSNLAKVTEQARYGDEVARVDRFQNPYTGKTYNFESNHSVPSPWGDGGRISASELASMVLQHIYNDPALLARKDPGLFDFIFEQVLR